jgi:hypothetical protein
MENLHIMWRKADWHDWPRFELKREWSHHRRRMHLRSWIWPCLVNWADDNNMNCKWTPSVQLRISFRQYFTVSSSPCSKIMEEVHVFTLAFRAISIQIHICCSWTGINWSEVKHPVDVAVEETVRGSIQMTQQGEIEALLDQSAGSNPRFRYYEENRKSGECGFFERRPIIIHSIHCSILRSRFSTIVELVLCHLISHSTFHSNPEFQIQRSLYRHSAWFQKFLLRARAIIHFPENFDSSPFDCMKERYPNAFSRSGR